MSNGIFTQRHLHNAKKALVYIAVLSSAWFFFKWYNAIPSCAAGQVREAVEFNVLAALRAKDPDTIPVLPKMLRAREVGYASARRERGCIATVRAGKESVSYAYIVSEREYRRGTWATVTAAHPLFVAARFGNIDNDGDFGNKAEPVGRDNLEAALRAALETPSLFAIGKSISLVEPLGSCRQVRPSTQYVCDVMVELSNPMQSRAELSSRLLQVEFAFERDAARSPWRLSNDFHGRYMRAVHEASKKRRNGSMRPGA